MPPAFNLSQDQTLQFILPRSPQRPYPRSTNSSFTEVLADVPLESPQRHRSTRTNYLIHTVKDLLSKRTQRLAKTAHSTPTHPPVKPSQGRGVAGRGAAWCLSPPARDRHAARDYTPISAEWQSGYAAACKAAYLGSIPGSASSIRALRFSLTQHRQGARAVWSDLRAAPLYDSVAWATSFIKPGWRNW